MQSQINRVYVHSRASYLTTAYKGPVKLTQFYGLPCTADVYGQPRTVTDESALPRTSLFSWYVHGTRVLARIVGRHLYSSYAYYKISQLNLCWSAAIEINL